jgi:radical SAM superfamily enzyme YgiQ (UPF0313 family)
MVEKEGIRAIDIYDETFNSKKSWVMEFCRALVKANLRIRWRCRCRPNAIDDEMAHALKAAGCHIVTLGVESANPKTLKFLKKAYSFETTKRAIAALQSAGIQIHGYFILGSPNETRHDMMNTIDFAISSRIEWATFTMLTPLPGTELERMAQEKNWYMTDTEKGYSRFAGLSNVSLKHPMIPAREISRLYRLAYWKFYLRPRQLYLILRNILFNPIMYSRIIRRLWWQYL